jgi:hypothetical protein
MGPSGSTHGSRHMTTKSMSSKLGRIASAHKIEGTVDRWFIPIRIGPAGPLEADIKPRSGW